MDAGGESPVEFVEDLAPAAWLAERIRGFAENVGSVVPHGFAAYARIFHPATLDGATVRWADVARDNETAMHAEAQFEAISGVDPWRAVQDGLWDSPPDIGHIPGTSPHDLHDVAEPLVQILTGHTTTPEDAWFLVWEGWGGLHAPEFDARFHLPNRAYWLMRGPVAAVRGGFAAIGVDGPSIWWRRPGVVRCDRDRLPLDVRRRLDAADRRAVGRPEVRGASRRGHARSAHRQ